VDLIVLGILAAHLLYLFLLARCTNLVAIPPSAFLASQRLSKD